MSDSLRDMFVGIRFNDKASNDIEKVNKLLDTAEQSAERLGKQLGLAEKNINRFGNAGATSTDGFEKSLEDVSDKVVNLQKYLEKYGRAGISSGNDVEKGSEQAKDALNSTKNAANKAADATDEVGDSASSAANEFGHVKNIGVNAWTAVATAAVGAATTILGIAGEYDQAMDRIASKTGLAGAELVGVQDTVKNVFNAGIGADLATVADEVTKIKASLPGLNKGELETFAKNAMTVGDLWGYGSDEVTRAVKSMTSNFKGLNEEAALDLLTVGFQKTGDYSNDLLDTFSEYSVYFSKMGLSAQEFTGMLVKGAESGAWSTDLVADAVKEMGILSIDGSKNTAEGFKMIGLNANHMAKQITQGGETANQAFYATIAGLASMDDKVAQNQAGIALFGTKWEDLRESVILSMGGAKTAVQDFEGAAQKATDTASNNVNGKLTSAWRGFKSEMVGVFAEGGKGADITAGIVDGFTSALGTAKEFTGFVVDNWGLVTNTVIGLSTAVGTFALIMGGLQVVGVVNTLMTAYRTGTLMATLAQWGLNTAMLANPMTWVAVGISGLVAAGVLLYRNWDTVREKTGQLWDKLGTFKGVATLVLGPLGQIVRTAVTMAENWDNTKSVWDNVWSGIKISAANSVNDVIGSINALIGTINKIPGVHVPIIPKVDWGETKAHYGATPIKPSNPMQQQSLGLNKKLPAINGSHATGLASVPFDGYRAELHKDEAVLTAKQSDALRSAGILSSNGDGTPNLKVGTSQQAPVSAPKAQSTPNSSKMTNNFYITVVGGKTDEETGFNIKKALDEYFGDLLIIDPQVMEG